MGQKVSQRIQNRGYSRLGLQLVVDRDYTELLHEDYKSATTMISFTPPGFPKWRFTTGNRLRLLFILPGIIIGRGGQEVETSKLN